MTIHRGRSDAGEKSDTARVALLSISFDPENDDRAALRLYGERFGAKPPQWRIAAPADAHGLDVLLKSFGVVVIPDGMGGFIHNGAIYLVDAQGRLARILDPVGPAGISRPHCESLRHEPKVDRRYCSRVVADPLARAASHWA